MSSLNNGGGDFGSSGGLPAGVTQAQLDEIKSFNAGLSQAGTKSRGSRPRGGGGLNRGTGSGISSARLGGNYSSATSTSRSGNGAGYGGSASYSVGPTTALPITKSTARENVPIHLRGVIDVSKTRWANLDNTGAGTLGNHSIGPLNSAATPPKTRSRSPTRSSILTTQYPQPSPPKLQQQPPAVQPLQNVEQGQNPIARIPTPPGRVRIVTNMTPDDPSKPFIPAHLRQTSCRKTIEDIARMTGIPLNEITSDGISIPAHPPQALSPRSTFAPVTGAPRQADVDQQNWLNLAKSKKQNIEGHMAVDTSNIAGTPYMNGTAANAQPMLSESRWASGGDATVQQKSFASAFSTVPTSPAPAAPGWGAFVQQPTATPQQPPRDNGWGQPQMTGQQAKFAPANSSTGWDTVGNNRWTQGQPDQTFGSAVPAQSAGFASGPAQVQATPSNAGGFSGASTAQAGGFGSGPAQNQSASSYTGGFGSAAPVQSAGFASVPAQAIPFPLLNPQGPPAQQSGWGGASHGFQGPSAQGVALAAPNMIAQAQAQSSGGWGNVASHNPTAVGLSGHARIPSQSMSDVEMTGGNSILDTPVSNLDASNPVHQVIPALPTLADSRWATPSWNTPQAVATGFGRPSQGPTQPSAGNGQFENMRQPLTETGTGSFSFINAQNVVAATVNNGWSTAAASVSAIAPAKPHPFGNISVTDFNDRVARELRQVDTNARAANPAPQSAVDPTYGPAHLRPTSQIINRTFQARTAENAQPKKEDNVRTLKDSRWAY